MAYLKTFSKLKYEIRRLMVSLPEHDWTVVGEALSAISQSESFIGFGRKMYTDYEIVCRVSIRKICYYVHDQALTHFAML